LTYQTPFKNRKTEAKTRVGCAWFLLPTCAIKANPIGQKFVKPCHFQNQSRPQQKRQDLKVKAKWDSAAQGKFVTSTMRAFRKPAARVCEDSKKSPTRIRGGNEICGWPPWWHVPGFRFTW
jgi:hypothetical protein